MDQIEAGRKMKAYRKAKGLTQKQVVERTALSSEQYLSALENGKWDVRNSEHFKSLISLYGLSMEQVRELDPEAVVTVNSERTSLDTQHIRILAPLPIGTDDGDFDMIIMAELQHLLVDDSIESIELDSANEVTAHLKSGRDVKFTFDQMAEYTRDYLIFEQLPEGLKGAIRRHGKRYPDLMSPRWQNYLAGFRWRDGEPEEPEAWLDLYRDLTRAGVEPGGN